MAAEDYVVADRPGDFPVTANKKVTETVFENPDAETQAAAEAAGVSRGSYIDYATALEAFEDREDIETLADRRAREIGADFDAGAFMRAVPDGTPPSPGTVDGKAPASA